MITERGTVKVTTPITRQVQGELNKASKVLGIVYTVIGAVLLAGFLVGSVASGDFIFWLAACGAFFLTFGIILINNFKKFERENTKRQVVDEVEFFLNYCIAREFTDGEHTSTIKIYYNRVVKVKETAHYLFIYNTLVTAVSVDKYALTPPELNAVKKLLGKSVIGAVTPIQSNSNPNVNNGYTQYGFNGNGFNGNGANVNGGFGGTVPPADPFSDVPANGQSGNTDNDGKTLG